MSEFKLSLILISPSGVVFILSIFSKNSSGVSFLSILGLSKRNLFISFA